MTYEVSNRDIYFLKTVLWWERWHFFTYFCIAWPNLPPSLPIQLGLRFFSSSYQYASLTSKLKRNKIKYFLHTFFIFNKNMFIYIQSQHTIKLLKSKKRQYSSFLFIHHKIFNWFIVFISLSRTKWQVLTRVLKNFVFLWF